MRGGQLSKARRGELQMGLPVGLVYDPAGHVRLDPDKGVQDAIAHLFATFARTGSARAVVQAFNQEELLFPTRTRTGPRKGELAWTPLRHWRVLRTLHNPRYAGAFAYGRTQTGRTPNAKIAFHAVPRDQWTALIHDAHPGYISWEQFEINERLLKANAQAHGAQRTAGPAREGPALLQGLAICGRCGRRMTVRYHQRHGALVPDYQCIGEAIQDAAKRCLTVPGSGVDDAIGQLLLDTVTPLALDVALTVQAELEARADEADQLRQTHVQRARQRADLARQRYLAVDPGNRLVADTLEADWNDALRALQSTQDDYERASTAAKAALDEQHKARIRELAADFPKLCADPATAPRERKRITRLLIEDVTLARTDEIHLHVRLRGGQSQSLKIPAPLKAWQARQTDPDTLVLLDRLLEDHTDAETAEQLNAAGQRSGAGQPFTATIVIGLRRAHHLASRHDRLRARGLLTQTETAQILGIHPATVGDWRRAGLLASHKANDKNQRLYEPPDPGDPRLAKQQGRRLDQRELIQPCAGGAL